jgi:hypothetical protein
MQAKLEAMLQLQDSFNKKVHPNWIEQGFRWDFAIMCEAAELMEHAGYKWWKKQDPDMNQMIMEMVDIWHFGMSMDLANLPEGEKLNLESDLIVSCYINSIANACDDPVHTDFDLDVFKDGIALLTHFVTQENAIFADDIFFQMWYLLGLNLDDLYKKYIGKNALNEFRQLNGYKDGSYIKIWHGEEDNEQLTKILDNIVLDENLYTHTLTALSVVYETVK